MKNNRNLIIGVLFGLLVGFVAVMFEVPSVRALARVGALGSLAGLVGVLLLASNKQTSEPEKSIKSERGSIGGGALGFVAALVILAIASCALMETHTVKGGYIGVSETFAGGVDPQPNPPKTYVFFRPTTEMYDYDIQPQKFDNTIEVKSSDNQKVHIPYSIRWRRDPAMIVQMHTNLRNPLIVLEPESVKVVNTLSTAEHAINIYSGETQNKLRASIEKVLADPASDIRKKGVIIDQFVFGKIELDPAYVQEIEKRQIAVVAQSRAEEQRKAALAQAEVARAEAQSDLNKQVVAAERDKQVAILQQQATSEKSTIEANARALNLVVEQKSLSEKQVLAAKAQAEATIANAEATKTAELARAVGIEAVGRAEAQANKLKLESFQGAGGENYTKIEVAKQVAIAYQNQKGYLPSNMSVNLLTENFDKSVNLLIDGSKK